MSTTTPLGHRETRDGAKQIVFTRTFAAPLGDVWAACTEPERMERWIGTWTGDPASGEVAFRMTAEGDDVPEEVYLGKPASRRGASCCAAATPLPSRPTGPARGWHGSTPSN